MGMMDTELKKTIYAITPGIESYSDVSYIDLDLFEKDILDIKYKMFKETVKMHLKNKGYDVSNDAIIEKIVRSYW